MIDLACDKAYSIHAAIRREKNSNRDRVEKSQFYKAYSLKSNELISDYEARLLYFINSEDSLEGEMDND